MLCGPNIARTRAIAEAVDVPVIASGGVSKLDDIRHLVAVEIIDGVIAGRSLYEGHPPTLPRTARWTDRTLHCMKDVRPAIPMRNSLHQAVSVARPTSRHLPEPESPAS